MHYDIYNEMIKCIIVIALMSAFNFFDTRCLHDVKI